MSRVSMYLLRIKKTFYDLIGEKEQNIPIFLLGSSMGSFIAVILAATYLKDIDGLVLASTGTKLGGFNFFTKVLAKFLALITPKMKIEDPNIHGVILRLGLCQGIYERSFGINENHGKIGGRIVGGK